MAFSRLFSLFEVFWAGIPQMTPENFQLWQWVRCWRPPSPCQMWQSVHRVAPTGRWNQKRLTKVILIPAFLPVITKSLVFSFSCRLRLSFIALDILILLLVRISRFPFFIFLKFCTLRNNREYYTKIQNIWLHLNSVEHTTVLLQCVLSNRSCNFHIKLFSASLCLFFLIF